MKFTCSVALLKSNLELVSKAIHKRSSHPILENIKIESSGSKVTLSTFDLNIGIQAAFLAEISTEGILLVPGKLLCDIINKLPTGEVEINDDENKYIISIESGSSKFNIKGSNAEEYPELPIEKSISYEFPADSFMKGLNGTLVACSDDKEKYILQGVNLSTDRSGFRFCSTDGRRIGSVNIKTENSEKPFIATIPSSALSIIAKILHEDEKLEIQQTDEQMLFKSQDWILTSRLLEGKYPDVIALVPKSHSHLITIERKLLIERLERISIFTSDNVVKIILKKGGSQIQIIAENNQGENAKEEMDTIGQSIGITIGFNIKYLIEGLETLSSDTIDIRMQGQLNPVVLADKVEIDNFYLLMPIQLK
jgi:DNA polymerase III subunit beta